MALAVQIVFCVRQSPSFITFSLSLTFSGFHLRRDGIWCMFIDFRQSGKCYECLDER